MCPIAAAEGSGGREQALHQCSKRVEGYSIAWLAVTVLIAALAEGVGRVCPTETRHFPFFFCAFGPAARLFVCFL